MQILDPIISVGIPKSGSHALHKLTVRLGRTVRFGHLAYRPAGDYRAMIVTRNPRALAGSWLRFTKRAVTIESLIAQLREPIAGHTLLEWHRRMCGWLTDSGTMRVRYESLLDDDEQRRVATFIGAEPKPIGARLLGGTESWSGRLTNWRDCWDESVERAWQAAGGAEMESTFGY